MSLLLSMFFRTYAFWNPRYLDMKKRHSTTFPLRMHTLNAFTYKKLTFTWVYVFFIGADEGNWTPVSALARLCSTIELHLHNWRSRWDSNPRSPPWQGGMLTTTPLDLQLVSPQCLYIIPWNFLLDKWKMNFFIVFSLQIHICAIEKAT